MTLFPYLLLAFALLLLFVEFFVPGGLFAMLAAGVLAWSFLSFGVTETPFEFLLFVIASLFLIALVIRLAIRVIRKSGKRNTIMLDQTQEGFYASSLDPSLFGKVGVVHTDLRPSGKVEVEEQIIQAISTQGYLVRGTKVVIVGGEGTRYTVRKDSTHGS